MDFPYVNRDEPLAHKRLKEIGCLIRLLITINFTFELIPLCSLRYKKKIDIELFCN